MKQLAQRELGRVNAFEKLWRIQTSEDKFKIIPLAQSFMEQITINNKVIRHTMEGTLLGLKLKSNLFNSHIIERVKKGNGILIKLKRFSKLTPAIKATLI